MSGKPPMTPPPPHMPPHVPTPRRRRPQRHEVEDSSGAEDGSERENDGDDAPPASAAAERQKKMRSFWTRLWSSVWMICGFAAIVWAGHLFIWGLIVACQVAMSHELFTLAARSHRSKHPRLPPFHFLNWHFFTTAAIFVYGGFMDRHLAVSFTADGSRGAVLLHLLEYIMRYHLIICYTMYITGFVWFILSLKKGQYRAQFGQYGWCHMILFVVFLQSSCFVASIFQGIIWFLLPASLIIINDIAAYLFGFFFGRTPLIQLSPKKTWEGFLGASVTTLIAAFLLAGYMGSYPWLTCPRKDLGIGPLRCTPGPMFAPKDYRLPAWIAAWGPSTIRAAPVQMHALAFGAFASSIAPFGGFFASGFKRAFHIKDFGHSIPGHGGITDRMDCQMVMALFAYIYLNTFVLPSTHITVESLLPKMMTLGIEQQQELYVRLGNVLRQKGLSLEDLHTSDPQLWPS